MTEVKTLQFPNTPAGQAQKNKVLAEYIDADWRVVSETITQGHMKGNEACCLALICLPFGFAAGRTEGMISVTVQRESTAAEAAAPDPSVLYTESGKICRACGHINSTSRATCKKCRQHLG